MNAIILEEWLNWFDARMEGRKGVLLIDKFLAHESGLEVVEANGSLKNVQVIILPVNATSVCQPLNQGVIRSWKAHYHCYWVQCMVDEHRAKCDPNKLMHVLQTLQ
jgi:hypothetical protein